MSYYVRCFCSHPKVPTLQEVLASVVARHPGVRIDSPSDLKSPVWKEALLHYKEGKAPIDVQVNRSSEAAKGIEGALGKKEILMVSKEGGAPKVVTPEELSRHAGPGWRNLVQEEVAEFKELLEGNRGLACQTAGGKSSGSNALYRCFSSSYE